MLLYKIDFLHSDIIYSYKFWKLPKSIMEVPIIELKGKLTENNLEKELKQIIFRIEEVLDMFAYGLLIIDIKHIESYNVNYVKQLNEKIGNHNEVYFLVKDGIELERINYFPSIVEALSYIAYKYKKNRSDGGLKMTKMARYNQLNFTEISTNISDINVLGSLMPFENYKIGLIEVSGSYGYGSEGANDAKYLAWRLNEFVKFAVPDGLIIDYKELHYEWGDDIRLIPFEYNSLSKRKPYRLVLLDSQRDKFNFLLRNKQKYIESNVEDAIDILKIELVQNKE